MKKLFTTLIKASVFFVAWAVLVGIGDIPSENPAVWRFGAELFPLLWTILVTIVFWLIDKRKTTVPMTEGFGKSFATGTVTGVIWIGASTAVLVMLGTENITGRNDVSMLCLWIISAFLNTIMQELLVRGYIYQLIKREYSIAASAVVSTALFTLMHGGAFEAGIIPVLNVITMSLFMTALYEYSGSLIAPIMAHGTWNIIGSIVLGGVSLADDYTSVFIMEPAGNTAISGGEYMIEASIVVLLANIIGIVIFTFLRRKETKWNSKVDSQFTLKS